MYVCIYWIWVLCSEYVHLTGNFCVTYFVILGGRVFNLTDPKLHLRYGEVET